MEKKFVKIRSIKDIVISLSIALLGSLLAAIPDSEAARIGGYLLLIAGAILALLLKSRYMDVVTKAIFIRREFHFADEVRESLLSALASDPNSIDLANEGRGQRLRLELYYSEKRNRAYLQLSEYVPHRYKPCSEIYEYEGDKVAALIR